MLTAAWIVVKVACGQSPSVGVLSTHNVVPDEGGSGGSLTVLSIPITVPAVPATVVSRFPSVVSGVGRICDFTTFTGSTAESGSFCQAPGPCAFAMAEIASTHIIKHRTSHVDRTADAIEGRILTSEGVLRRTCFDPPGLSQALRPDCNRSN